MAAGVVFAMTLIEMHVKSACCYANITDGLLSVRFAQARRAVLAMISAISLSEAVITSATSGGIICMNAPVFMRAMNTPPVEVWQMLIRQGMKAEMGR